MKGAEEVLYAVLRDKVHYTRVFTCRYSVNVKLLSLVTLGGNVLCQSVRFRFSLFTHDNLRQEKVSKASKDMPATHTLHKTPTRVQNQTSFPFPSLSSFFLPSLLYPPAHASAKNQATPPFLLHQNERDRRPKSKTNIPTLINH